MLRVGKVNRGNLGALLPQCLHIALAILAVSRNGVYARFTANAPPTKPDAEGGLTQRIIGLDAKLPPPPLPENITVSELPLPPVTTTHQDGACTWYINPQGTGCVNVTTNIQSGSFTPDGKHVIINAELVGAPHGPDSRSIYSGLQIIIVKTNGNSFPNGDPWKCLTCGLPRDNTLAWNSRLDYPQAFKDGKRVLAGKKIIDCSGLDIISDECTGEDIRIYPIRWNTAADGSGEGGTMRELRIHPDDEHLAWSSFTDGGAGQLCYLGKLHLNLTPTTGFPLSPRYDLEYVNILFDISGSTPLSVDDRGEMSFNSSAIAIGEIRGFSGTGREVTYIGYPSESSNIDVYAIDLIHGHIRRLTNHPEYADPVEISPDDDWTVLMDTRTSGRQMFLAGMRSVPPITDIISIAATSSTRNNGRRRFFQPWLIDRHGERGAYIGQQVNGDGDGSPGSINDVNWNGLADPKWSPDGTQIVYHQALVVPPACGGANPLPCPSSTAACGRTMRLMLATLNDRAPMTSQKIIPAPDMVPWAIPYIPGQRPPSRTLGFEFGNYTMFGTGSGYANVSIFTAPSMTTPSIDNITISVTYNNFSSDSIYTLNGYESLSRQLLTPTLNHIDWYSTLIQDAPCGIINEKKTSADGFHLAIDIMTNIFGTNGTLTTTVDGVGWRQPENGT